MEKTVSATDFDIIIIGGGFYGSSLALHLHKYYRRILIIEKDTELLQRASLINQARVHNGYHYPRSILTAFRSRENFQRFVAEFDECIDKDFNKFYAISRLNSKVTADQFKIFCQRIEAPVKKAQPEVIGLFNPQLIEDVFEVKEYAFDAVKLKHRMKQELADKNIDVWFSSQCDQFNQLDSNTLSTTVLRHGEKVKLSSRYLFNCTFSSINAVNKRSGLNTIPLKHELTEMALIKMPEEYSRFSVTVMCGPFFSIMPFPSRKLHSLSHVRYTPHYSWHDDSHNDYIDPHQHLSTAHLKSNYNHMFKDVTRYLPLIEKSQYIESLWEIKTVLPQSEVDDSRPILFKVDDNSENYVSILGGKIDNIYDIQKESDNYFACMAERNGKK